MELSYQSFFATGVVHVNADRLDANVAILFKDRFRELVGSDDQNIVLDLTQVEFLDSSGLGAVVAAKKILGDQRALALAGLSPMVAKVMELTRMNTVFPIHDTVADALSAA